MLRLLNHTKHIPPFVVMLAMLGVLALPGCCPTVPGMYTSSDNGGYPPNGTFQHRMHTEMYDAARKINRTVK